jgi:hypothetical protein
MEISLDKDPKGMQEKLKLIVDNKFYQLDSINQTERMRVPDLINFFNRDPHSDNHIYAHKEYFYSNGKRETVIKPEDEIFRLLRTESKLLQSYMYNTYNIQLDIDPEEGYIKHFPFRQRWLRGEEYGFLCRHYYAYSHYLKMFSMKDNDHPEEIYHQPKYGQFYFIKNMHLQFFGFPRRN